MDVNCKYEFKLHAKHVRDLVRHGMVNFDYLRGNEDQSMGSVRAAWESQNGTHGS